MDIYYVAGKTQRSSARVKKIIEVSVLACVIIIVWCLFALPTVFYAISVATRLQQSGDNHTVSSINQSSNLCADGGHTDFKAGENGSSDRSISTLCSNTLNRENISCAEGFSISVDNDSTFDVRCQPLCSYWLSPPTIQRAIAIISIILQLVATIAMLVVAWLQRDSILTFPTAYLVLLCLTLLLFVPLSLIQSIDFGVFCHSDNLLESLMNETAFCTASGVVHIYVLAQVVLWTTFHAFGILRGIAFPFVYRRLKVEKKIKYINASTVVIALVLPLIPALLHLIDGYSIAVAPVELCVGANVTITYYTLLLPCSILLAIATTSLIIVFWKILKEFLVNQMSNNSSKPKNKIRHAQVKILFIMIYYILYGVLTITIYTTTITSIDIESESFEEYFFCQSVGVHIDRDCGPPPVYHQRILVVVAILLVRLMPIVILAFTVKCTCNCYKSRSHKLDDKS